MPPLSDANTQDSVGRRDVNTTAYARLAWRTLAIASWVLAVGAVVALAIVAAVRDANSLSTVALALAVIAFGVQLIVYIAQVGDSTDTRRHTAEVNTATQAALARIGTVIKNSDQLLRGQHSKLVDGLLGDVRRAEQRAKSEDSGFSVADVLQVIADNRDTPTRGQEVAAEGGGVEPLDWTADPFQEWLQDANRASELHGVLKTLDPIAIGQLTKFAEDYRISQVLGTGLALSIRAPGGTDRPSRRNW